ncbi:MAG: transcription antitermination factor NusB [Candidatus Anammoximicrobium sp.]|nr:transcription antitermination factor NusB [Candidatus Anammoximicrobium sp.]
MSLRSQVRQVVLQLLYQDDLNPEVAPTAVAQFLRKSLNRKVAAMDFALSLLDGVREHREELDQVLSGKADNWSVERMAVVDRNILRLGAYEILYTKTPGRVVINEAIELAKQFGAQQSPAFVNGILDRLLREHQ